MNQEMERFYELVEKSLEDKLKQEELQELEAFLNHDSEYKEIFFQLRHQHANLSLNPKIAGPKTPVILKEDFLHHKETTSTPTKSIYLIALAATILLSLGLLFLLTPQYQNNNNYHAVLEKTEACIWHGGSLPTLEGSQLENGTLHLDRGFASLRFHSGAYVKLEGPAKLKIIDDMNCELLFGNLVADVPESAHKFRIKTQKVNIIDLGTSFSLNVKENGDSIVNVIEGEVIAKIHQNQKQHHLLKGESAQLYKNDFERLSSNELSEINNHLNHAEGSLYNFKLRSDEGKGDDTYVYSENHSNKSNTLLLIKNGGLGSTNFQRQAFIRFDLNRLPAGEINHATLQLEFLPTGFGSGMKLPDSQFTVYAIIDDQYDDWSYKTTKWENASILSQNQLNHDALLKLGSFIVPRGKDKGIYDLPSDLLKHRINNDENRLLNLIVVRDTQGNSSQYDTLVHGVASRRHPVAQPPTLKIKFSPTPQI
jgi:hypothetical protein